MNVFIALVLNFLPFILCFAAFKIFLKMKFSTELFASLWGLIAVLPITFIQFYLMSLVPEELFSQKADLTGLFCKVLVLNGLLEEGIKTVFMLLIPRKKLDLKGFFAAAVLSGICLGCFESMVYFLQHLQNANQKGAELLYGMIFTRMFSSDLIHALCAGLCGLFIWGARNRKSDVMCLVYAVFIHGIFDFFVYFDIWIHWFAVAAVLFAIVECRIRFVKMAEVKAEGREYANSAHPIKAEPQKKSVTRSKSGTKQKSVKAKENSTLEKKIPGKTKTRARKVKSVEEVIAEPEVTQEFNDDL